jgi:hypothetical protein
MLAALELRYLPTYPVGAEQLKALLGDIDAEPKTNSRRN